MTDERRTDGNGTQDGEARAPADRAFAAAIRAHVSRPAAPPALRARVEAALAAEVARAAGTAGATGEAALPPRTGWRVAAPALAAGLAALLVAAATAAMWSALPDTSRRLALDAVREAQAEYERLEEAGPTFTTDDPAALSQRLTDGLGVRVRIGDPPGGRVRPRGTAPSTLFGSQGVAVFYVAEGETITLSFVPSPAGLPQEGRVRLGRGRPFVAAARGTRFVLWRQGPLFCALAGDFPERTLTAIFRTIRPGIEVGG